MIGSAGRVGFAPETEPALQAPRSGGGRTITRAESLVCTVLSREASHRRSDFDADYDKISRRCVRLSAGIETIWRVDRGKEASIVQQLQRGMPMSSFRIAMLFGGLPCQRRRRRADPRRVRGTSRHRRETLW